MKDLKNNDLTETIQYHEKVVSYNVREVLTSNKCKLAQGG